MIAVPVALAWDPDAEEPPGDPWPARWPRRPPEHALSAAQMRRRYGPFETATAAPRRRA